MLPWRLCARSRAGERKKGTSEHVPCTASEKEKERGEEGNALEPGQRRVALKRFGDGTRTLVADGVSAKAAGAVLYKGRGNQVSTHIQREGKEGKENGLEIRQRRINPECLSDRACAIGIDFVTAEAVCVRCSERRKEGINRTGLTASQPTIHKTGSREKPVIHISMASEK